MAVEPSVTGPNVVGQNLQSRRDSRNPPGGCFAPKRWSAVGVFFLGSWFCLPWVFAFWGICLAVVLVVFGLFCLAVVLRVYVIVWICFMFCLEIVFFVKLYFMLFIFLVLFACWLICTLSFLAICFCYFVVWPLFSFVLVCNVCV